VPAQVVINWLTEPDIDNMPPTAIRYWYGDDTDMIAMGPGIVDTFQKLHPNISIIGREAPRWVDNQALLAYIKAGTSSHVHQSVYNEDLWYIANDVLMPLDDLPGFEETRASLRDSMNYQWEGTTYSLSWHFGGPAVHYNKTMVEEAGLDPNNPPKLYSEFFAWAEALTQDKDGDGEIDQWFMAPEVGEDWWWWEFIVEPFQIGATGEAALTDGTKATFNNPMTVAAFDLFGQMFSKGYAAQSSSFATDGFLGGMVAAQVPGWMGNDKYYTESAPPGWQWFVGPIPKPDDATTQGNPCYQFVRNFALVKEVKAEGEEQERIMRAAWEFEKYLLSPGPMQDFMANTSSPVCVADLLENPMYAGIIDERDPGFRQQIEYTFNEGILGDMSSVHAVEYMNLLQQAYLKVIYGKATAQEAVDEAEQLTNDLLAQG
jgi:multiple sugar transport system substrate-binding protein